MTRARVCDILYESRSSAIVKKRCVSTASSHGQRRQKLKSPLEASVSRPALPTSFHDIIHGCCRHPAGLASDAQPVSGVERRPWSSAPLGSAPMGTLRCPRSVLATSLPTFRCLVFYQSSVARWLCVGQGARFLYSFAVRRSIIGSDEQLWEPQLLRPIPRPRPSRRWRKAVRLVCTPLRRSPTRRLCARRELRVGSLRGRFASREQICE